MVHIKRVNEMYNRKAKINESDECYRVYDCSEIFKDFDEGGKVTQNELNIIKKYSPDYKEYEDEANGYTAFALNFFDEDKAFDLVDELNNISNGWYVGDKDEEYVFVD